MNLDSLIFSNKQSYRLSRHFLFWIAWILYDTTFSALGWQGKVAFTKSFFSSLLEITLSIPLDMGFCYAVIYFLIPKFLFKGRYISMVLLWLVFSLLFIIGFNTYDRFILPYVREWCGMPKPMYNSSFVWIFFNLFSQINMEGCVAASIKLGKLWHIKQQELDLLKKEKSKIEPYIENGQVQPVFLVDILTRIELLVNEKPTLASGMIKKIKNLVMYVLYDNNQAKISLEKELNLLKEYVELERMALDGQVNIVLKISGNFQNEEIAPFIILPVAENAFKQLSLHDLQKKQLRIDIKTSSGIFNMKITWDKPIDTSTLAEGRNIVLQNLSKRLNLIYPHSHELKMFIKVEQVVIDLTIKLKKAINM